MGSIGIKDFWTKKLDIGCYILRGRSGGERRTTLVYPAYGKGGPGGTQESGKQTRIKSKNHRGTKQRKGGNKVPKEHADASLIRYNNEGQAADAPLNGKRDPTMAKTKRLIKELVFSGCQVTGIYRKGDISAHEGP